MVCMAWLATGCGGLDEDATTRDVLGRESQDLSRSRGDLASPRIAATCGDAVLDVGEQCDDGNVADHDGCSAACTLELVAQFAFTGAAGNEATFAAELADPALAATPVIGRGLGVTPSVAANAFSAAAWTINTVVDPDDFYTFTVAPSPGQAMTLRALQLDERRSATGIRSWSVRSSLDGFTTDLAVFVVPDDLLTRTQTVVLPAAFSSLLTAVELRVFGFQAESAAGTWRVDNVTLIGEVALACGNGTLDAGEQCDDGNVDDHDGCSAVCTFELVTQFLFTGAAGNELTFAADVADPELVSTPELSRGLGLVASVAADAFSAAGWTASTALDPDDFYSVTLTPNPGATMKLVALQLDERRSATGIRSWSVRSSLDGFASDLALITVPDDILFRTQTIALPAPFQSLTTAVELRLFGFEAEFPGGTWRVDNVRLLGEIEPACGNGALDGIEQCDDGNRASEDGCSATCTLEIITQFSFPGAAGNEAIAAADLTDARLAAIPELSRGPGIAPSVAEGAFSASGWTTSSFFDPGDFYSFTVTPTPGATMKLLSLQLDERRSATGIRSWVLRSSLDAFATDLALVTVPDDILFRTQSIPLPAAFHSLTSAVELRLFAFGAEFSSGTWRVDNVTLFGVTED